jgi:D-alanine transaminase
VPRISYVNGRYVPHGQAVVQVEDRGYQFADSVYEVMAVVDGRLCHVDQHMDRLGRSLAALEIAPPSTRRALAVVLGEVARRNRVWDGVVYLQVSRGVARRNHLFPTDAVSSVVVSAWPLKPMDPAQVEQGVSVVSRPDLRWKRPDIKATGLLPNVLAKQSAREAGAFEALLVNDKGFVTEGSATNAFIVARDGALLTHPADQSILPGITRANVLALARAMGIEVGERPFTLAEALAAREAFVTGTTMTVMPVARIDGTPIGTGKAGPVTLELRRKYQELRA